MQDKGVIAKERGSRAVWFEASGLAVCIQNPGGRLQ